MLSKNLPADMIMGFKEWREGLAAERAAVQRHIQRLTAYDKVAEQRWAENISKELRNQLAMEKLFESALTELIKK